MLENNIYIMLGSKCNLSCKFCFIKALKRIDTSTKLYNKEKRSWLLKELTNVIKYYTKNNIISNIIFFGGEPLIYIDTILDIVESLKNYDIDNSMYRFSITTNLTTNNALESISKLPKNIEISTSFDTKGRFTHNDYSIFISNATTIARTHELKIISVLKEDININNLQEVVLNIKPRYVQLEKYTVNNKVIPISANLKNSINNVIMIWKKAGIELVSSDSVSGIGCFRDGHCSSITLDVNSKNIMLSCPKLYGDSKENKLRFNTFTPDIFITRNTVMSEELNKQLQTCVYCKHYKNCSAYCRVSGCMNFKR